MDWAVDASSGCVITGGSTGIGLETAIGLARRGAHITIVARHPERTPAAAAVIRERSGNPRVDHVIADFASLASVRVAAEALAERHPRLTLLINNAGVWHPRPAVSRDGYEDSFAVNHLAHFVLTRALLPRLAAPARIIHVSSRLHRLPRALPLAELAPGPRRELFGFVAYSRSKLCNLLLSAALTHRLPSGVVTHSLHPGDVRTDVGRDMWLTRNGMKLVSPFLLTPEQGAATTLHVATAPHLQRVTGRYFVDRREAEPSPLARDAGLAESLWSLSEELAARH